MGRPRKDIDRETFEKLCAMQCTQVEFCDFFGVDDMTLARWCKRTYKRGFSEVFRLKRSRGKVALRRAQFEMALKNPTMAIWLGKQWLGQSDAPVDAAGAPPVSIVIDVPRPDA